jgi:hypothetical protein
MASPDPKVVMEEFCTICERVWMDHDLYESLFSDGRDLVLYAQTAPMCFLDLNGILIEHLVIQFCKLTDPGQTGKYPNLTTNFILNELPWPADVQKALHEINERLMAFRKYIEPARNKRAAHTDLAAQITPLGDLGAFPKGDDAKFLADLQEFVDVAYQHLIGAPRPIHPAAATDSHQLIRALGKAILFDGCGTCTDAARIAAVLDYEARPNA